MRFIDKISSKASDLQRLANVLFYNYLQNEKVAPADHARVMIDIEVSLSST